jgi:adenylylsulfate kinase-like enzyme
VTAHYEPAEHPALTLDTAVLSVEESVDRLVALLRTCGVFE